MNYEQVKGSLDRLLAVGIGAAVTWLATKGYFGESDAAVLAPALVALISAGIGIMVNRRSSIAKSASNLGDVVVTKPSIANRAEDYPNVISNNAKPSKIIEAVTDAKAADPDELNRRD